MGSGLLREVVVGADAGEGGQDGQDASQVVAGGDGGHGAGFVFHAFIMTQGGAEVKPLRGYRNGS